MSFVFVAGLCVLSLLLVYVCCGCWWFMFVECVVFADDLRLLSLLSFCVCFLCCFMFVCCVLLVYVCCVCRWTMFVLFVVGACLFCLSLLCVCFVGVVVC